MNSDTVLAGNDGGTIITYGALATPATCATSVTKLKFNLVYSVVLNTLVSTVICIV